MSRPPERHSGGAARFALPLTVLLMMSGAVIAVNPGHYGPFGIAIGVSMVVLGGVLTVRLFRASEAGAEAGVTAGVTASGEADADDTEPGGDRPVDDEPVDDRPVDTQ